MPSLAECIVCGGRSLLVGALIERIQRWTLLRHSTLILVLICIQLDAMDFETLWLGPILKVQSHLSGFSRGRRSDESETGTEEDSSRD